MDIGWQLNFWSALLGLAAGLALAGVLNRLRQPARQVWHRLVLRAQGSAAGSQLRSRAGTEQS